MHLELDGSRHGALTAVPLPYPLWGLPVAVSAGTMRWEHGPAMDDVVLDGYIRARGALLTRVHLLQPRATRRVPAPDRRTRRTAARFDR